ncbi:hypothetical protein [Brevundimonas lenta]|uniref:Uncharacterized protein n=1 Tax=Brevundimonas lenta TaxID=424796 RepID=A0A7W6JD71_9CAUL|nr:hypothetical protein [Brevundimonas lenta]MBB4082957.1 hypothetical protein [Brevundimonas lenta]
MMRLIALGSAALLGLAACSQPLPEEPASAPAPGPATPSQPTGDPVSAGDKLTAQGFGPLRIGMTRAEVEAALGPDANPNAVGGPDPEACDMFRPNRAPEGMLVMLENGVLTSVWVSRNAAVETDRALNVGDTAAEVKRVYGASAEATPHKYVDAPAEYITVWTGSDHTSAAARGLKYEIGTDGKVSSIAAGGPSIQYVEGCA